MTSYSLDLDLVLFIGMLRFLLRILRNTRLDTSWLETSGLSHTEPCGDDNSSRWLGCGRTSTWMLRQTEVTGPVNVDHPLPALLAGGSQTAHKPWGQDDYLSELTHRDCRLLMVFSWFRQEVHQVVPRQLRFVECSLLARLLHSSEFLNSYLICQRGAVFRRHPPPRASPVSFPW